MVPEERHDDHVVAVLVSGGLDSGVLVANEVQRRRVQPIYVSVGLAWEADELTIVEKLFQSAPFGRGLLPLVRLEFTMRDVYGPSHWAIQGTPPEYDTPDEAVYLVGRNVVLLAKGGMFCARRGIHHLLLGPLAGNPFPDATPEFFNTMARALTLGLAHELEVLTPFAGLRKTDVVRLGRSLGVPFELTLSCMSPRRGLHCGLCSKCRERRDAFVDAGIGDPTTYANPSPR